MSRKIIKCGTEESEIDYFYTEITKENVNKWQGLKKLAKYMRIKEKEIATIGDNINDLEMIQNAGMGIVIGNSALSKRNLGKPIVSDNNSDGVAEAIEKYIIKWIYYKNITDNLQMRYKQEKLLYISNDYCIIEQDKLFCPNYKK